MAGEGRRPRNSAMKSVRHGYSCGMKLRSFVRKKKGSIFPSIVRSRTSYLCSCTEPRRQRSIDPPVFKGTRSRCSAERGIWQPVGRDDTRKRQMEAKVRAAGANEIAARPPTAQIETAEATGRGSQPLDTRTVSCRELSNDIGSEISKGGRSASGGVGTPDIQRSPHPGLK